MSTTENDGTTVRSTDFENLGRSVPGAQSLRESDLPLRPSFLPGLVLVPVESGLVVDGTYQRQLFKGEVAQALLPHLIRLMDGTRTLQELQGAFPPATRKHVRDAVLLLFRCGLVQDGEVDHSIDPIHKTQTFAFFERYVGVTRVNQSGREAQRRLDSSEVVIFDSCGAADHGETLKSLLQETGVRSVLLAHRESLNDLSPGREFERSLILSLSFREEDCEWHAKLDDWCSKHDMQWLRAVIDLSQNQVDLGPLFIRGKRPCYRCFCDVHYRAPVSQIPTARSMSSDDAQFWISMVAIELIYLLSRIGPLATATECIRYNLEHWEAKRLRWARVPGCSRCRPLVPTGSEAPPSCHGIVDTAVVFEDYVSLQSRSFSTVQARQEHASMSGSLSQLAKHLPNFKQYKLNRAIPKLEGGILDTLREDSWDSPQPLTADELATVLMMTAGIRDMRAKDTKVQRWAATGGNLGSVELFASVRRVDGLPPGTYFYEPRQHALALLQWRDEEMVPIEKLIRRMSLSDSGNLPDVLILFTAAFHRVARKYGPFAYRLINLDAGAAVSQLQLVAKSLKILPRVALRWADDLIENQLKLEPFDEQSTAVVALFRGASTGQAIPMTRPNSRRVRPGAPPSAKKPSDFCGLTSQEVTKMLYHESRVKETDQQLGEFAAPSSLSLDHFPRESSLSIPLPIPAGGGPSLGEIVANRSSVRRYRANPVSLRQLSTMLHYAHVGDAKDSPEEHDDGHELIFLSIAWRVDGLRPAVYVYRAPRQELCLWGPAPHDGRKLFVQSTFGSAPLSIWIVGNLANACARQGAFGHRQLLLRAGAAGHRLWMAALGVGLSGCLVAGVVPGAARQVLGLDGYQRASLLAFATGHQESSRPFRI
jgi:SagB-type dehydrogenase family enzyme